MALARRDMLRLCTWAGAGLAANAAGLDFAWAQDANRGPIGLGLCIGLNSVDPSKYRGWSGLLTGCVPDVDDMSALLRNRGFLVRTLWDQPEANRRSKPNDVGTKTNVRQWIERAAAGLKSGDIFVVSYSGHGSFITDTNGDEPDRQDETWCLYDGEVIDDVRADLWSKFAPGVRIVVVSDSCHSGSMAKTMGEYGEFIVRDVAEAAAARGGASRSPADRAASRGAEEASLRLRLEAMRAASRDPSAAPREVEVPSLVRLMPPLVRQQLEMVPEYQDELQRSQDSISSGRSALREAAARVHAFGACQDRQTAADGTRNGLFTSQFLAAWNAGENVNYEVFFAAIRRRMPYYQVPNLDSFGGANPGFDAQQPFIIGG
jgi:hypothetical protein